MHTYIHYKSDAPPPESFTYPTLPPEPHATRMIRLLPHEDSSAPIQCEIFSYDLSVTEGEKHLYEALSYAWESEERSQSITLNGCTFHITKSLHTALTHLRNRQLERTLWVDAISIDQDNINEKNEQIPLMRSIYAQAERVLVWLGEAIENGDKALEAIRYIAQEHGRNNGENYEICLRLLERAWFRRVWVLQEVGVARNIYIICGPVQINGHVFCEGLKKLRLSSNLLTRIRPVVSLIKGALYRPKYELNSRGTLPIGELISMYRNHQATEQHDKVYALLGLSADSTALKPDYNLSWDNLFQQVLKHTFPRCSVKTSPETGAGIVKGKGWILGYVHSVDTDVPEFGQQKVRILFNDTAQSLGYQDQWEPGWILQASGESIQDGDVICLLEGTTKPSVVRLSKGHFTIVTPAVAPQEKIHKEELNEISREKHSTGLCDILLTWKILQDEGEAKVSLNLTGAVSNDQEQTLEIDQRINHTTFVIVDMTVKILELEEFKSKTIENLLYQNGAKDPIVQKLVEDPVGKFRYEVKKLSLALLQHQAKGLPSSKSLVTTVAESIGPLGYIIMVLLLHCQGDSLPVSDEAVRAVAGNDKQYGPDIMKLLLQHRGNSLPVSEEVVKAAAGNWQFETIKLLFQHRRDSLQVSDEVVNIAAGNIGSSGPQTMELLLQHRGNNLIISEEAVKAAAGNILQGEKVMMILLQHRGEKLPVTEEVVEAAAGNIFRGKKVLEILLQHRGNNLIVSEEAVKLAVGNRYEGKEIIEILLQHRGESLPVTEEVVKAAAMNDGSLGLEILKLLLQHRGDSLPVTEEVVEAASGNIGSYGPEIMELLLQHRGDSLTATE